MLESGKNLNHPMFKNNSNRAPGDADAGEAGDEELAAEQVCNSLDELLAATAEDNVENDNNNTANGSPEPSEFCGDGDESMRSPCSSSDDGISSSVGIAKDREMTAIEKQLAFHGKIIDFQGAQSETRNNGHGGYSLKRTADGREMFLGIDGKVYSTVIDEWTCDVCGNFNYKNRKNCNSRKCGAPAPISAYMPGALAPAQTNMGNMFADG